MANTLPDASARILGLVALGDLVVGLALTAVGLVQDNQTLSIVGLVLLLSGAGMLSFVIMNRNKPQSL